MTYLLDFDYTIADTSVCSGIASNKEIDTTISDLSTGIAIH